jgi:hypothetical protein
MNRAAVTEADPYKSRATVELSDKVQSSYQARREFLISDCQERQQALEAPSLAISGKTSAERTFAGGAPAADE